MTGRNTGSYGPLLKSSPGRRQSSDTTNANLPRRSVSFGPVTFHEPQKWDDHHQFAAPPANDSNSAEDVHFSTININIGPGSWDLPQPDGSYQMPGAFLPSHPQRIPSSDLGMENHATQSSSSRCASWGLPGWRNPLRNGAAGSRDLPNTDSDESLPRSRPDGSDASSTQGTFNDRTWIPPNSDSTITTSDGQVSPGLSARGHSTQGRSNSYTFNRLHSNILAPSLTDPAKCHSNWKDFSAFSSHHDKKLAAKRTSETLSRPIAEEPRPYKIPEEVAERSSNSHQVQLGQSALHGHAEGSSSYKDTFDNPYAVFVFKYRSRGTSYLLLVKCYANIQQRCSRDFSISHSRTMRISRRQGFRHYREKT
jgi:hypothetical protein